jgi:site-specific recombinase XerD
MVLGSAATLTPDQARLAARKILSEVALGEDPAASRTRARETPTFLQFADRYLSEEAAAKLKPKSVTNYRIYVHKHAKAFIGSLRLDKVAPIHVVRMHQAIGQTKPSTANRVVECISSIYRYAATCGLVEPGFNPTRQIHAFREQRRERFLKSEELARLGEAIREAETTGIPWLVNETRPNAKHLVKRRTGGR